MERHRIGGVLVATHDLKPDCLIHGCVIHKPSLHNMRTFPLHRRDDTKVMERTCPHGVGHPDPDALKHTERTRGRAARDVQAVHGCDGCCTRPQLIRCAEPS